MGLIELLLSVKNIIVYENQEKTRVIGKGTLCLDLFEFQPS